MKKATRRGGRGCIRNTTLSPAEQQRRALERLELRLAVEGHPSPEVEARRLFNLNPNLGLAIDTADTVISSMLNKTGGQALRVAGLLHLARTRGMELVIPGQEMALATSMVDQLVHETRGLHQKGASTAHPFLRLINRMSWNRGNPKPVGWQDIRKRADQSQRDEFGAVGFGEAAQALASMDFGSVVQTPRGAWIYIASREMPA